MREKNAPTLSENMARAIDRRSFLKRVGGASVAALAAGHLVPSPAAAGDSPDPVSMMPARSPSGPYNVLTTDPGADEVGLLDRARTAPGWRYLGNITNNAFRESCIVYYLGNYYVYNTFAYETHGVAVRIAPTPEGIVSATPITNLAPLKYPSVVVDGNAWHMWGTDGPSATTKHYTAVSPTGPWTYKDTMSPAIIDTDVKKHPTNGYWYAIGFLNYYNSPLTLLRAPSPTGPWTDLGNVYTETGVPPFATEARPDPTLAFTGGRDYIFFSGRPFTLLGSGFYPTISEINLDTARVKGSPTVLMDERELWMIDEHTMLPHGLSDLAFLQVPGQPDRIFGFGTPWGVLDLARVDVPADGRRHDDLVRLDTKRGFDVAAGIRPTLRAGAAWRNGGLDITSSGGGAHSYPAVASLNDFTLSVEFTPWSIAPNVINTIAHVAGANYATGPGLHIYIDTDGVLKASILGNTGSPVVLVSSVTPAVGSSYGVVFRKSGTEIKLWVNGVMEDKSVHGTTLSSIQIWSVGGQKALTQPARYPFIGTIHSFTVVGASLQPSFGANYPGASVGEYALNFNTRAATNMPWSANDYVYHMPLRSDKGLALVQWVADCFIAGTNDASNYWTINLYMQSTLIASVNTSAVAPNDWRRLEATSFSVNPSVPDSHKYLEVEIVRTGSSVGDLLMTCAMYVKSRS